MFENDKNVKSTIGKSDQLCLEYLLKYVILQFAVFANAVFAIYINKVSNQSPAI